MSTILLTITPISATQVGTNWDYPINALPGDSGAYATNAAGDGPIIFTFPTFGTSDIPLGAEVIGVEVDLNWGLYTTSGLTRTLTGTPDLAAKFQESGSDVTAQRYVTWTSWIGFQVQSIGGPTDTWSYPSWSADAFREGLYKLAVLRPAIAGEDSRTNRLLESAIVKLTLSMSTTPRLSKLQKVRYAFETTAGTFATPTKQLLSTFLKIDNKNTSKTVEFRGQLVDGTVFQSEMMAEVTLSGNPTYDEIGVPLSMIVSADEVTMLATGVYQHVFTLNPFAQSDCKTMTLEQGDFTIAEKCTYTRLTDIDFSITRKANSIKGKGIGQAVIEGAAPTLGPGQIGTITIAGATGGTFPLSFKGAQTSQLPYNPTASAIQTALQALPTIGAGNILVSGTGPFTYQFAGTLLGQDLPALTADPSLLTGTSPTVTVAITTQGGLPTLANIQIEPGQWAIYYGSDYSTLSSHKLANMYSLDMNFGGRFKDIWTIDSGISGFTQAVEGAVTAMSKLKVPADSIGAGIAADAKATNPMFLRAQAVGPQIGTSGINRSLTIDQAIFVKEAKPFSDEENTIFAREFDCSMRVDNATGISLVVTLVNDVPSY